MKRYKCNDCCSYVSLLVDVQFAKCSQCDGELVQCPESIYPARTSAPSCKIQYLVFDDGARELIVSGHSQSRAFRY